MQSANLSGPFRGCLYYALLGLPQATGLAGGYDLSFAIIHSDTVQTNLVSNQYQQAKRQAKKPVFMRVSEVSKITPTRQVETRSKLFCIDRLIPFGLI